MLRGYPNQSTTKDKILNFFLSCKLPLKRAMLVLGITADFPITSSGVPSRIWIKYFLQLLRHYKMFTPKERKTGIAHLECRIFLLHIRIAHNLFQLCTLEHSLQLPTPKVFKQQCWIICQPSS